MIACEVFIPLVAETTRLPWPPSKMKEWEEVVERLFNGWTYLGAVKGAWKSPGGPVVRDLSHHYRFFITDPCPWRAFMAFCAAHFDQDCLAVQVGVTPELVDNPCRAKIMIS